MTSLADNDVTRRQMLAAMLAGGGAAAAGDNGDDEQPDTDAAPVPTTGPYTPLVNPPPPKGYSPPYGPPPWSGLSNPLAMALAGGGASAGPSAGVQAAPAGPPRVPQSAPAGAHYAKLPGPPLLLPGDETGAGPSAFQPVPAAAPATGPSIPIAGQASDMGTPEQQEIFKARQALRAQETALTAQINGTSNVELIKALAAQRLQLTTHDQQLEQLYLGTLKAQEPLRTVTAGQHVYNYATHQYDQPVPEEDTNNPPTEEQAAMLRAAGQDPTQYTVASGKPEPIPPAHPVNTEIVHLADGTFQTVDKQTGKMIGEPIGKPTSTESSLTPQAIEELASRSIQGDNSGLAGLGYGKLGSANRAAVANRVASMAGEQGVDATGIVRNIVGLSGEKAGARTMGQLGARINTFAEEAKQTGAMALQKSDAMPREAWVPIEKIIQMGEGAMNDPKLSEFMAANNAFANTYSKAVNPSGVSTDEGKRTAFELLNVAKNPEAYRATVQTLQREMNIVQNAISTSRGTQLYGGEATPSVPGVPPQSAPQAKPPSRHGVYVPGKGIQFQ